MLSSSTKDNIPAELLGAIFRRCLAPPTSLTKASFKALCHNRVAMSLVSRHWNTILASDPQVWSSMCLDLDHHYPPLNIVTLWLQRAAHVPINLLVAGRQTRSMPRGTYLYTMKCFNLILPRVPRWRMLTLDMGQGLAHFPLIPLYMAKGLEEIKIVTGDPDNLGFTALMDLVYSVPSLQRLTVDCSNMLDAIYPIIDPASTTLTQLTQLNISVPEISPSLLIRVLRCSTSAVDISIAAVEMMVGAPDLKGEAIVTLPYLRNLKLDFGGLGYDVFAYFNFPRLEVLHHSDVFWVLPDAEQNLKGLQTYIKSSRHSLRILRIRNWDFSKKQLLNLFAIPQLSRIPIVEVQAKTTTKDDHWVPFSPATDRNIIPLAVPRANSRKVSFGWILPKAYDSTDEAFFLHWGPEFHFLLASSRALWEMAADPSMPRRSTIGWGATGQARAFQRLKDKGLEKDTRSDKVICFRPSSESLRVYSHKRRIVTS